MKPNNPFNPGLLAESAFRERFKDGNTVLHLAAKAVQIHKIQPSILENIDLWTVVNNQGNTPLHLVADYGIEIKFIPRSVLIPKLEPRTINCCQPLDLEGKQGNTAFEIIVIRGNIALLLPECITFKRLMRLRENKVTMLEVLAQRGQLEYLPEKLQTPEILAMPLKNLKEGTVTTAAHQAIGMGNLNKVPEKMLTNASISTKNSQGYTVLHVATGSQFLGQVPKRLLIAKNLQIMDNTGNSVISHIIRKGSLKEIPTRTIGMILDQKTECPDPKGREDLIREIKELKESKKESSILTSLRAYRNSQKAVKEIKTLGNLQ